VYVLTQEVLRKEEAAKRVVTGVEPKEKKELNFPPVVMANISSNLQYLQRTPYDQGFGYTSKAFADIVIADGGGPNDPTGVEKALAEMKEKIHTNEKMKHNYLNNNLNNKETVSKCENALTNNKEEIKQLKSKLSKILAEYKKNPSMEEKKLEESTREILNDLSNVLSNNFTWELNLFVAQNSIK
jgi:hypothetical protein